jgi:cellobiose transport system substrate-binding protein
MLIPTRKRGRATLFLQSISAKNVLCSLLLLLPLTLSLASCGFQNTGGKVALTLWYWNRSIDDNLINQVSKVFPNVVLVPEKITDYDQKVRAAMAGHSGIPDIIGINSNIATYFPDEDQFYDLQTLGADDVRSEYVNWKWNLGIAPDDKMIGFPMDSGPTALFYRADIFAKAGLPTDPQLVSAKLRTWDDYLQAGLQIKQATQGKSFVLDTITSLYSDMMYASPQQYFDRSGSYIANQPYMQSIWNETIKANQMGVSGKLASGNWNQEVSQGVLAAFVGAVWMKQILEEATPDTTGKWRVAYAPGGNGNDGGSFLAITKACQHPQEAFEVIKWLQSPQNQAYSYKDIQLFPSAPAAFNDPSIFKPEAYYGGEDTTKIFADAMQHIPTQYVGPYDGDVSTPFTDQLNLVEYQNKNPNRAWNDAQKEAQQQLMLDY